MKAACFHFHGYQPGDIVRWLEPDPLKPQRHESRRSPVALKVGSHRVAGRNWTEAVLSTYGRLQDVLGRAEGAASVDIEPQTLVWLLDQDPAAYRQVRLSYQRGTAGLVLTPPFHPILPHHHAFEREVLFELMLDFYAPILHEGPANPVGLWLPEAAYSADTMDSFFLALRRRSSASGNQADTFPPFHLILDGRQFLGGARSGEWASLSSHGIAALGRDHGLSSDFAFGHSSAQDVAAAIARREAKDVLIASDLEALLAHPVQAERYEGIVNGLRREGVRVGWPVPSPGPPFAAVADFSSWSDYDEHLQEGHTSDTRWTGLRRADGVVVSCRHLGHPVSQIWKHGLTLATERIETAIRRSARDILRRGGVERPTETLRRLAVAYGRHLFRSHFIACGFPADDVDFPPNSERILRGRLDIDVAGRVARGYLLMLMGLRSDSRFWDNLDTRVTFQNIALLSESVLDIAEAAGRVGDTPRATRLLRLLEAAIFEYSDAFERNGFDALRGLEGWETTSEAWLRAVQSEVPQRSPHDVVRRAVLYSVGERVAPVLDSFRVGRAGVVADTGHIVGEGHGDWENRAWCEHRVP
jgi:hypothetical protein